MFTSRKEYVSLLLQDKENGKRQQGLKEAAQMESRDKYNNQIKEIESVKESRELTMKKYIDFRKNVKKTLLAECINKIYTEGLGIYQKTSENEALKKSFINNFIDENGVETLLTSFKGKSYLLSEYARIVEKYSRLMLEAVDKDKSETFDINPSTKDNFYDELNMDDISDVVTTIRLRVTDSLDQFINSNVNDQAALKEIIQKSQEKADGAKQEELREFYELQAKRRVNDVKGRKIKNIFECMVINLAESSVKNEKLKEVYTENSRLNMDKIVDSCRLMYTFLETVNTCKMVKVDEKYIEKTLASLKA